MCLSLKKRTVFFTQIPGGDVKNLQSNFLINKLLSDLDSHSDRNTFCKKHDDEKLKLFCQTCDQLICRDCIIIDHRDHAYNFVKDVYPAEKKKIEKAVNKCRAKISYLEATIKHLGDLELKAQANCEEVTSEIDAFIDNQVTFLEKKRKSLKNELKQLARVQKEDQDNLKGSLTTTLKSVKQAVGQAKQLLKSGHEEEVLGSKKQIMKTLTKVKFDSAAPKRKQEFVLSYYLEVHPPLNNKMLKKMAKIRKRVEVCGDGDDDDEGESSEEESTSEEEEEDSSECHSPIDSDDDVRGRGRHRGRR